LAEATGPLRDMTIIDCTMALAGPFGTALLADLGANVIKVEPPQGDMSRSGAPLPPDFANANVEDEAAVNYGGYFASINRNKRSIVLDFKNDKDREKFLQLCEQADAIVENMRSGVMDKLGLGYEIIAKRNPKIVYGCIRGFGDPRTGKSPYSDWPAYDAVAQAMSGLAHITGPEGEGGYPCGVSVGDIFPGTLMALGVVSAVHNARQTGQGQFMDVAMYDAMLAFCETLIVNYGYPEQRTLQARGRHHPNLMPFGMYPTSDGAVAIAAPGQNHWEILCQSMGRKDLIDDERAKNTYVRRKHQVYIEAQIAAWTSSKTKSEIVEILGGEVPCGPVNTAEDIYNDPHVAVREMITRFQLPGDNPEVAIVGTPFKFTETKAGFYRLPPNLGEHTEAVLDEFNIPKE